MSTSQVVCMMGVVKWFQKPCWFCHLKLETYIMYKLYTFISTNLNYRTLYLYNIEPKNLMDECAFSHYLRLGILQKESSIKIPITNSG